MDEQEASRRMEEQKDSEGIMVGISDIFKVVNSNIHK